MSLWSLGVRSKIFLLRVALIPASAAFFVALLFWWKYKNRLLEYLLGFRPRVGLALHYAQDALRRGEPQYKKGQKLRVLRDITAHMIVVPKYESTVKVTLKPGELVYCVGRNPASEIDLAFRGNIDAFVNRCIEPKERGLALSEIRGGKTAYFFVPCYDYVPSRDSGAIRESFEIAG